MIALRGFENLGGLIILNEVSMTPDNWTEILIPEAVSWMKLQEDFILRNGIELTEDQKIDAYLIGIKQIEKIRLLKVDQIPYPKDQMLIDAMKIVGILSSTIIGCTFGHGIVIKSSHWSSKQLIIHELTHTLQYERFEGIENFLPEYVNQCLFFGYKNAPLEKEARFNEKKGLVEITCY